MLAFLNEVAGGRRLLEAIRERVEAGAERVAVVAPQNQPMAGQIVDRDEVREAALSRVEVTQAVLEDFGIEAVGAVMDPDPAARPRRRHPRLHAPRGAALVPLRHPVRADPQGPGRVGQGSASTSPVTHIPVRIEDDAVRWDVTHTLVVATQTVASADLIAHLKRKAAEHPHRYTIICPRSGDLTREEVCERLARTLAELYRADIDATGQPMSPEPLRRDPERDRALPDRRGPDLDPRRRAVEVARGGADRAGPGDHRQAGRALRGRRRRRAGGRRRPLGRGEEGEPDGERIGRGRARREHEHHGPPEAHQSSRIDRQTLGILLFIVSEVMLFGAFFASYFFLRVVANVGPWPPEGFELPKAVAGVNTAILISSSFTVHWALESIRRGNRRGLQLGLAPPGCSARPSCSSRSTSTPHRLQRPRRRLRLDLLRPHGPARRPRLRRPDAAGASPTSAPGAATSARSRRAPRRRGAGDLLALRRRDVDHRLHDRLHPLETAIDKRFSDLERQPVRPSQPAACRTGFLLGALPLGD